MSDETPSRLPSRATLTFIVATLVFLPFRIWRATLEGSFWKDEFYSLMLIFHSWNDMISLNAGMGAHPPFYYMILRWWHELLSIFGEPPGLFSMRALSILVWMAMSVFFYILGRRLIGDWGSLGVVLLIWLNPDIANYQLYIRNYSFVYLAVGGLVYTMLDLIRRQHQGGSQFGLWVIYTILGIFALYSNLLTGVILFLLGLLYLYNAAHAGLKSPFTRLGLLSQFAINAAFIPYVIYGLTGNVARIADVNYFMPEPTIHSFLRYFYDWFLWGGLGGMRELFATILFAGGIVVLLTPFILTLVMPGKPEVDSFEEIDEPETTPILNYTLFVAIGFVLILWMLSFTGIYLVYHPRYLTPASIVLTIAFVTAIKQASERSRYPVMLALALYLPMVGVQGLGTLRQIQFEEYRQGPIRYLEAFRPFLEQAGEHLYVMPTQMIPFYKNSLGPYNPKPIEEFQSILESNDKPDKAVVVDLSRFHYVDFQRDIEMRFRLDAGIDNANTQILESAEEANKEEGIVYTANDYYNKAWLLEFTNEDDTRNP